MQRSCLLALLNLIFLLRSFSLGQAASYTFTPIDAPGSSFTSALAINNRGQIIADGRTNFVFSEGTYTPINFNVPGALFIVPKRINDSGTIVGSYTPLTGNTQGFVYDGTNFSLIAVPGAIVTEALGINNKGHIVGYYIDSRSVTHGFVFDGANFTTIDFPGASGTSVNGINDQGHLVGGTTLPGSTSIGFVYDGVNFTPINFPGALRSTAYGINNIGAVVGTYSDPSPLPSPPFHGFLFNVNGGSFTLIDFPGALNTTTRGINDLNWIVGNYFRPADGENFHGYLGIPSTSLTLPEKAAELAKSLKGAPYGYGGKGYDFQVYKYVDANAIFGGYTYNLFDCSTAALIGSAKAKGVDCSGLVMWSYNTASGATAKFDKGNPIQYPTANGQYLYDATIRVSKNELKPGDLLFFNYQHGVDPLTGKPKVADHVAMYVGGDDILEAYTCLSKYPSGNFVIPSSKSTRDTTDPFGLALPQCVPGMTKPCFVDFRRVPVPGTTSSVNLRIATHSPVTLAVTDPDGFSITANSLSFTEREVLREVADVLYYIEDTNNDDTVISPVLKTGAYLIKVFPKTDTNATDTYSVIVDAAGSTLTLADKVPIRNIPSQGYGIRSTGEVISQFIPVAIDIKPGSSDNSINPKSNGNIPVAILSSTTFNALQEVNAVSLSFGRTGNEQSLALCNTDGEDVNGDGLLDLVCHFDTQTAAFRSGDMQGVLNGKTVAGVPMSGKDSIRIVP